MRNIKSNELSIIANDEKIREYFSSIKVFGSVANGTCTEDSDIDMFVTINSQYLDDKSLNKAYLYLSRLTESEKDIFFAHEQCGKNNPKLYENMQNGIEILK